MDEIHSGDLLAGKYRVERVLGAGGMGFVVAATHIHLEQLVALKFIKQGALESDEAVLRFLREARAAVRLKNEHVARVYDVGTLESGEPYMVMEYLEGQDLHDVGKRGQLPIPEVCEYVMQACEALAEAHSLGIVHRDIKPANLFLTQGRGGIPNIKVLDFGISRVAKVAESTEIDVTSANTMLGSPRYMSPEQMLDPTNVDGRTDVWSLGTVLYKLLSGALPFDSETLGGLLNKVMNTPLRPIRELRRDLPQGLVDAIAKCLAKDRKDRYGVAELARAIAPFAPPRSKTSLEHIAEYLQVPEEEDVAATAESPSMAGAGAGAGVVAAAEAERATEQARTAEMPSFSVGQTRLDIAPSEASRKSSPPTGGTAAPWATGAASVSANERSSRTPLIVLALGLAGIVAAGGLFVFGHKTVVPQAPAASTPPPPTAAEVFPVRPIASVFSTPDPAPPAVDPESLPIAPRTPTNGKAGAPRKGTKVVAPPVLHVPTRPQEPPAAPKPEEGIPTTRD